MSLLLKNVRVLSTRYPSAELRDVFIVRDKISAIGALGARRADYTIDGRGSYCVPGFFDFHTTSDHHLTLLENPLQEDFLGQGITGMLGGHCGASLAPLLYGSLDPLRKWTDPEAININWRTVRELFQTLERRRIGVHFGTLIGHTTIRQDLIGDDARDLTDNELDVFVSLVARAMDEGAYGISFGLGYAHTQGVPYHELVMLGTEVAKRKGIISLHVRKIGTELVQGVSEGLSLARDTGAPVFFSHLMPLRDARDEYLESLRLIDEARKDLPVFFGVYPFDSFALPLYSLLPTWVQRGNVAAMRKSLKDPWERERILKDLPRYNAAEIHFVDVPVIPSLAGKTLADAMDMHGIRDVRKGILALLEMLDFQGTILHHAIDHELLDEAMKHSGSFITSATAAFRPSFRRKLAFAPRNTSTMTTYLAWADRHSIPIQDAITKITSAPQDVLHIPSAILAEGAKADITIIAPGDPYTVKHVIVSGVLVLSESHTSPRPMGHILRHRP